ncbi:molybdate ABC transporter substrate-binding protein [Dyella sp. C11]|uniref:molybdate ABC transporter substrate-binding protein n=1 Tax=Dyella sp. C11 TaxID=2126991 RepID=UPI000D64B44D|nr:molybdate ABC transporter substrate-binding protein [Dyella sp. C11]
MIRRLLQGLLVLGAVWTSVTTAAPADNHITVAAAADLHQALDDVVAAYRHDHPDSRIDVVYGSSGNLLTQIEQGAPFELFFSADSGYPQQLVDHGKAGGTPVPYALGHLVMWSASIDMKGVQVADLAQPKFGRIAIANPQHAPYGKRAEQALRAAGIWDQVQSRLVFGDNISQTAQFAQSGNAQVGLVAESLVVNSTVKGSFVPVPPSLYEPLKQSFVLTQRGKDNALAQDFASYVQGAQGKAILSRYGFNLPDDTAH